jgi:predicted Zn-dependent protease
MKKACLFFIVIVLLFHGVSAVQQNSLHRYFFASYNHFAGKMDSAHSWYKSVFDSPCSAYPYKGYITFLFDTKKYDSIITLMPDIEKAFENDPEMQLIFASSLEQTGQTDAADERLIGLHTKFKNNYGITIRTTQAYLRKKDPENALLTLTTFLNNNPTKSSYFILYYLKAQLNVQLNHLPQALTDITTCIDLQPNFDKGWLLQAQLLEQKGIVKDAIRGYYTFIELSGGNKLVEHHLAALISNHYKINLISSFQKSLYEQALTLYNKGDYKNALALLVQEKNNKTTEYKLLHLQLTAQLRDYDQLVTVASQWITDDNQYEKDIAKTVHLLSFAGIPTHNLTDVLQKIHSQHPHNFWLLLYCADLHIRNKDLQHAINALEKTVTLISSPSLKAHVCYQLSLLYNQLHNKEKTIVLLKQGYTYNTDHPYINNALAYHYATTKQISAAEKHIQSALKKHPQHPCFRDTQALIFYKQKEYEKSKDILEQLADKHTLDSLLLLAKTHYKLHNKEIARDYTKKIWPLISHEDDKQRLQKLERHLAYND